jgi:DNA-binding NarL/FixJ family response regulator
MDAHPQVRILLVDDHQIVHDVLSLLVSKMPGVGIAGHAHGGDEAIRLADELDPDVVVMDIAMPGLDGFEAIRSIHSRHPGMAVVALSQFADNAYVRQAMHAGALGYVLKKSQPKVLKEAIGAVAEGRVYVDGALDGAWMREMLSSLKSRGSSLSGREEEVIRRVAWGQAAAEIAAEIGLSVKTVESYKASALEKLKLRTRADIVRYALSCGWLSRTNGPH